MSGGSRRRARAPGWPGRRRCLPAASCRNRSRGLSCVRGTPSQRASRHRHGSATKALQIDAYVAAMRRIDRRHLLPGAAAFAAALLVALLGLNAGAEEPGRRQARGHRRASAARGQRLPRPPRAARARCGWRRVARRVARPRRSSPPRPHDPRPRRRHGRRLPADLEPLQRRAHDRGHQPDGLRRRHARQPRVRRGRRRGAAARAGARATPTSRRTPSTRDGGEPILPPYKIVERAGVKVGFIGVTTTDTPLLPALGVRPPVPLARPLRRGQPLRAGAPAPGRRGDRRPRPRRRLPAGRRRRRGGRRRDAPDGRRGRRGHRRAHPLAAQPRGRRQARGARRSPTGSPSTACDITVDRASGDVVSKSALVLPTRHAGIEPDPELSDARRALPPARRAAGQPGRRPRRRSGSTTRRSTGSRSTPSAPSPAPTSPSSTRATRAPTSTPGRSPTPTRSRCRPTSTPSGACACSART